MHATRLACPYCAAVLKSSKPLRVGKQITCLKCGKAFAITVESPAAAPAVASGASLLIPLDALCDLYDEPTNGLAPTTAMAEVASPPGTELQAGAIVTLPRRRRSRAGLVLALSALGLFIVVGIILAVVCLGGAEDDETPLLDAFRPLAKANPKAEKKAPGERVSAERANPANPKLSKADMPKDDEPSEAIPAARESKRPSSKEKVGDKIVPVKAEVVPERTKPAAKPAPLDEAAIRRAIDRGVRYLRERATPKGTWLADDVEHAVGYAALPALALLECGVPPSDPAVRNAADFVRQHSAKLTETYELGLAVVFLDRVGDKGDRALIRTLAARLAAGQTPAGGWDYHCPILTAAETDQFLKYLQTNRPKYEFFNPIAGKNIPGKDTKTKVAARKPGSDLPAKLRKLPVVVNQGNKDVELSGRDDNSNTQFGLLGLWAARRHDVAVEICLDLTAKRFQRTQNGNGGWGYVSNQPSKNSMTCVGLLGLAMGHGAAAEAFQQAAKKKALSPSLDDPYVKHALQLLGQYLKGADEAKGLENRIDLYYLWTLERVGMLYRQERLGDRDWYAWGCAIILPGQRDDGRWHDHYTPVADTSFALLFLRRSNLVGDLTDNLNLYLAIPRQDRQRAPNQ